MQVFVNGEAHNFEHRRLSDAVAEIVGCDTPVAIAVNEAFVPKSLYTETELNDGDRIEILAPMQGG